MNERMNVNDSNLKPDSNSSNVQLNVYKKNEGLAPRSSYCVKTPAVCLESLSTQSAPNESICERVVVTTDQMDAWESLLM